MDSEKLLSRGVEEVIIKEHLEEALKSGKKLRVKFGIDPTAPDLHLGHTVPLRKLRQFQDAGHKAVLIIGDFTARIGDPTGRSEERKTLSTEQVRENMKKYLHQAGKILDIQFSLFGKPKNTSKFELHYNSEWFFGKEGLSPVLEAARSATINQVIQRADFKKRLDQDGSVSILEALYPMMQGYDSVKVKADLEIGGSDQKFNLLMGRQVQKHFGMTEQDVMTLPLLEGTDGMKKMSKSAGNYIALDAEPDDMFGKIMRIPDNLIDKYYTLLTDQERKIQDPREAKLELAKIIVSMYHGEKAGDKAKENFVKVFSEHEKPESIPSIKYQVSSIKLADLLVETQLAISKSEARRLIEQGAVRINDVKKTDPNEIIKIEGEVLLQVGPRKFLRLK